jgi:hypothetical protein
MYRNLFFKKIMKKLFVCLLFLLEMAAYAQVAGTPYITAPSRNQLNLTGLTLTAAAAYSLRKLSSTYNGPAIRVRRTDNTEVDIGFTATGDLNTAALLAHVGTGTGNNGFVTTWYDQSGNGRHMTQPTRGSQPQIVVDGVIWTKNGRSALRHLSANSTQLSVSTNYLTTDWTINVVQGLDGGLNRRMLSGTTNWFLGYFQGSEATYFFNGGPLFGRSATVQNQVYTAGRQGTDQAKVYANGIDITRPTGLSTPPGGLVTSGNQNEFSNGSTQELTVFNASLSNTDRQTLERNQGAYYNITITH